MSTEDLNSLKEEIFLSIRQLEKKFFESLTVKTAQLSDEYEKYNEKLDFIIANNRNMIETVVSEKINMEKLNSLEAFKNKADGMLISHEIRINNQNKEIGEMKNKYDRVIEDNLIVPGFVGPKCQYNNVKEYISANISEMARIKYEKDQLKTDTKDFKSRLDGIFKQMINIVDNSVDRSKDYTNGKISENKKHFDTKIDEFSRRADDLRIEIQQTKTDIESQVNDLKLETAKINNFAEKSKIVDQNINKINNAIMKVNYEINKLYEKNQNSEKKIIDLKNDLAKIKVMTDIRNKTRNKQNNAYMNMNMNQIMEANSNYTMENIRRERNNNYNYNNNSDFIKEKNFSEKKNFNENKKKFFGVKEKKFVVNNLYKEETENKDNKNKGKSKNNKRVIKEERKNNNKLNMFKNHTVNNSDNENDEEKNNIISEESIQDNKDLNQNDNLNVNEFYKTTNNSNRIFSKNEDIINVNPNFREAIINDNSNHQNKFNNNKAFKKPEIIKRRISEIKFDLKAKSLKKVTYDINNENMIFPKINPNIIDNQTNFLVQDNPKENDNSITSESGNNHIINNSDQIKVKINKDFVDNNIIIKERRNTLNSQNKTENSNVISRKSSIKSLNEINEKMTNLPSYRNSQKNFNGNNEVILNNSNYKNINDKSPKIFDEDKYLLANFKKGRKKFNLSQPNNKNSNFISNTNSNYINNNSNTNQLFLSERDFPPGINLVGLNNEKINRKNSVDSNIFLEPERENNLKLEGLGIYSPENQRPKKKKIKLQGISTEAPLKISAAFGRTAYTFINKNNNKKIYSIQTIKKRPENEKLDIYLGSNS